MRECLVLAPTLRRIACACAIAVCVASLGCGGGSGGEGGSANSCSALVRKISNGDNCDANGSPVVPIFIGYQDGTLATCTGTFVSLTSILTAAHCVSGPIGELVVVTPAGLASTNDGTIVSIRSDQRYNNSFGPDVPFDFGVIGISFPGGISPVPVITSDLIKEGDKITVFGVGRDENNQGLLDRLRNGNPDELLKAGEMKVSGVSGDRLVFGAQFDSTGQSACQGDSGGPALIKVGSIVAIAGVVSFGSATGCTSGSSVGFGNLGNSSVRDALKGAVPDLSEVP